MTVLGWPALIACWDRNMNRRLGVEMTSKIIAISCRLCLATKLVPAFDLVFHFAWLLVLESTSFVSHVSFFNALNRVNHIASLFSSNIGQEFEE